MEAAPHPWPALGVLLMRDGLVSKEELDEILVQQHDNRQQRISGRRLGEILIQRGRVTPTQVAKLVAEQYELPFLELEPSDIDLRAAAVLSEDDARRFWAVPVSRRPDGSYLLAIADPGTVLFSDELRRLLGSVPRFAVVGPDAIEQAIDFVHSQPLQFPSFVALDTVGEDAAVPELLVEAPASHEAGETDSDDRPLTQTWPPLGALLVREGFLSDADLDTALAQQRLSPSRRLGEILVEKGIVTPSVVARLVAEQYELPFAELDAGGVDPDVARRLPEEIARRLSAVPITENPDGSVEVAIADPTSAVYSDELQQALDTPLAFVVSSSDAITSVLDEVHAVGAEPVAPTTDDVEQPVSEDVSSQVVWRLVDEPTAEQSDEGQVEPTVLSDLDDAFGWVSDEGRAPLEAVEESRGEQDLEPRALLDATGDEDSESTSEESGAGHEPRWSGRLELVDEAVWVAEPDPVEEDAFELAFLPYPELAGPAETPEAPVGPEAVADEADVRETASNETWVVENAVYHEPPVETDAELEADAEHDGEAAIDVELEAEARLEIEEEADAEVELEVHDEVEPEAEADFTPMNAAADPEPERETATDRELATAIDGALEAGATTIHFSPVDEELVVRARVDGVVRELGAASHAERDAVVAHLESEGRVRTHVVATTRGEKTTLFIREPVGTPTTIEELGADARATDTLRTALERPSGAVLVCGPAGSGTTTTLYAALRATPPNRIATSIEHPVERLLPDVDQIEVDPANGVTFASALRELRYTDPDVVLVGDLADLETTDLVLRAAYHGRLVLAALAVTGSSAAALVHLAEMGIEPTLLSSAVGCVVTQRLVRSVCSACRETYYASESELDTLGEVEDDGPRLLARGRGCPACDDSGFRGRAGLFEILALDDEVCELVREGGSAKKIQRAAVSAGMRTLRDEGVRLCLEGVTTVAEVGRVLGPES